MKEYKYKQYKIYIPTSNTKLIEILDSYSTYMRDKVIIDTLRKALALDGNSVSSHKRIEKNPEEYEQEAIGRHNNDEILKMLATLTEKIEALEHREAAGVKEDMGQKPMLDVPDEMLDFFADD
ncbi:MAG: hypothetical protein NC393_09610 [Clostridium sp.]|nr:hypothetical protein [Clostridium sp.]MCM1207791.1 hypothetical protein [Ruminococcus sp.]